MEEVLLKDGVIRIEIVHRLPDPDDPRYAARGRHIDRRAGA
jgi:hypothetical protein